MEMPNYLDYDKMYEMNPMAFHEAQGQLGLARQFQDQKLQQEQARVKQMTLANQFDEQNNPLRLQRSGLENTGLDLTNRQNAVKTRISEQTEGLQLDATQRKLIMEASKADLDAMEFEGQRMAYSPDPNIRAAGEAMLKMHKDFIKMREQNKFTADENAKQRAHQTALERERQAAMNQRAAAQAKLKADSTKATDKMSTDQRIGWYVQKAEEAYQAGDAESYNYYQSQVQYLNSLIASRRPDTMVGKPDTGAITGLPTVQPRPSPVAPGQQPSQQPAPAAPSLADVQRMYPGVDPQLLKEKYKSKFGVDLK